MSLDVTMSNTFSSQNQNARNTNYTKLTPTPGPEETLPPMDGNNPSESQPINLNTEGMLQINVVDENNVKQNFQISIKPDTSSDYPNITLKLSGQTWTVTNKGNNTSVQVGAGPDGQ